MYTGASNITWDGSRFYILDVRTFGINVYGADGALLKHSDKVGRGPGEFTMADQIYYNKDLDLIEILNPMGRIFRYTPDSLQFVSEVNYMGKGLLATHDYVQIGKTYILYSSSIDDQLWGLDTGETHFFYMTEEGMEFLPEIFDHERKRMFKFIDFKYLPEYINRDILDARSQAAYDKVLDEEGSAIAIYYL